MSLLILRNLNPLVGPPTRLLGRGATPLGVGESALLRTVSGLLVPRTDEILLDGQPIVGREARVIVARRDLRGRWAQPFTPSQQP